MAFTNGNDIELLGPTSAAIVSAGQGNDRYIISPDTLANGQQIQITDTSGANTLQLQGGLTIASSLVTSDGVQLTLSNGAIVTVLGASNFSFQTGGNNAGAGGTTQNFANFVTGSLGLAAVPAAGAAAVAGTPNVTVNANGGTSVGGGGNPNPGTGDTTAPALTGVVVNGAKAILVYNETLDAASQPAIGNFAVAVAAGGSVAVTGVQVVGNTVELTLGRAPAPGETFNVTYTPGANPIQDVAGNDAAAIAARAAVVDTTAPVVNVNQTIPYDEGIVTGVAATRTTATVIGKVESTDNTGATAYSITAGDPNGFFTIDSSGNVRLTAAGLAGAANDFEVAPNSFVLTVVARDAAGLTSAPQQVTLNVRDVPSDNPAPPPVNQVIQMTTGNDNVTPTGTINVSRTSDASDTVAAFFDGNAQTPAGQTTIGLGDSFDTAGGNADNLILTIASAAANPFGAAFSPALTNLEVLTVRSVVAAKNNVIDLAGISPSLNTLVFDSTSQGGAVDKTQVLNVANAVNTFGLTNNGANGAGQEAIVVKSAGGLTGAADAVTLNLSGNNNSMEGEGLTFTFNGSAAASGYELVTVNSNGATANKIEQLIFNDSGAGKTATSYTFNGSAGLTITDALEFRDDPTLGVVNGANATGALNLNLDNNANALSVTGGSGDDRFNFGANIAAKALTLNGGVGNDTIAVTTGAVAGAAAAKTAINGATSIEVLEFTEAAVGAVNANDFTSISKFLFSKEAALPTVSGVTNDDIFTFSGAKVGDGANNAKFEAQSNSPADVLNLVFSRADGVALTKDITATDFETINATLTAANGQFNGATFALNGAAGGTLNVTGAANMATADGSTALGSNASVINATTATGNLNLIGNDKAQSITGGSGNDRLDGGAGELDLNRDTINGGLGNDVILGDTAADVMTGGAGNDTFVIFSAERTRNNVALTADNAGTNTTAVNIDRITDFAGNGALAGDSIALSSNALGFGAAPFGLDATDTFTVTTQTVGDVSNFNGLVAALGNIAASNAAAVAGGVVNVFDVTVSGGTMAGRYVIVNDNTQGYSVANDAIINFTGVAGALNAQDFVIVA